MSDVVFYNPSNASNAAMLNEAADLHTRGLAVHWLHPESKRPVAKNWASTNFYSKEDLMRGYRSGYNLGFRPGKWSKIGDSYLHVIDFDIHDDSYVQEAYEALEDLLPELDLETAPTVISGSGGASRHFFFFTDKPFPKRKLARSATTMPKWQFELYGGTNESVSNVVLPPSIHPQTGKPYQWFREFDWDEISIVQSSAVERTLQKQLPLACMSNGL